MKIFSSQTVRWSITLLYAALVYYLCLMSTESIGAPDFLDKIYFDKWVHVMMYFGMWTLIVWAIKGPGTLDVSRRLIFAFAVVLCLIMGFSIEILQEQFGRSFDWTDELANFAGAMLGRFFWVSFENKWAVYRW